MLFNFGLKSSLLLVFFIHGLIFGILLLIKGIRDNDKSTLWLSAFTFLCTLYISPFMLGYAGWYSKNPYRDFLFYIPFQQLFLLPPVLYFYCKTLFDKAFIFHKQYWVHFLPAFLYLIYSVVVFVYDKLILGQYYFYQDGRDKDFVIEYQLAGFVSLLIYLIQSIKVYSTYRTITYNTISYANSLTFKWAQQFLFAFLGLLIIRSLFFIINPEFAQFGKKFWYYLCFSLLFYYISIAGLVNSIRSITAFNDPTVLSDTDEETSTAIGTDNLTITNEDLPGDKNEMIDLSRWKDRIEHLMIVDRFYENPELTIHHISQKLDTHSKKISHVINAGFDVNFNDYVNKHRVEAVIERMKAGEHSVQTLLSLGFECGFNSKSTFNRAFKRHTALSPKEFIKNNFPE